MTNFTKRIQDLPRDRKAPTVIAVRELIRDMWEAGWSANAISYAMGRDHTTTLHHLWCMEIIPMERVHKASVVNAGFRAKMAAERIKRKEEVIQKRRQAFLVLQKERDARTKRIQKDRERVLKFYKEGKSYRFIEKVTGFSSGRIESLLMYAPEYQKIKRPSWLTHGVPVNQLTKEGKFIRRWKTIKSAAVGVGVAGTNITVVCRGRMPSTGGFKWEYAKKHG